jgi:NTE family protein
LFRVNSPNTSLESTRILKTRFNTSRLRDLEELRASQRHVLEKLPKALLSDPDVQRLSAVSARRAITLVHFIYRHNTRSLDFKDYEFSRATVTDLWEGGHNDVRRAIANPEWQRVTDLAEGIRVFDLCREDRSASIQHDRGWR